MALKAIFYPDDTKADVKALLRATTADEVEMKTCAKAANFTAWNKAFALGSKANDRAHEAANLVRLDLNLPSVGG